MNILVTGANGLLGNTLVNQLSLTHKVYAVVGSTGEVREKENIIVLNLDLSSLNVEELPVDIDVIYYLAQSNHFREFPDKVMDILNINVYTPVKLASWAIKNGVKKFIYASSGGVYKHPSEPVQEIFDINANAKNGFYLDSKLGAEVLLRNFSSFFELFVIVRPFFMYGPKQNSSMLIPRLIHNIIDNTEITLSSENGIKINPIYIDDAANAIGNLLDLEGEHIFNIAGDEVVSLRKLSNIIGNIVNSVPNFCVSDNSQADLVADISQMKSKLSKPAVTLERGLREVYRAMKN